MKVLITGKKGQLGTEFQNFLSKNQIDYLALSRQELDISELDLVLEVVESFRPSVIINCAAYNLVDRAETEYPQAYRVNALGPRNLAFAAKKVGALLVHYSTDYVFDGAKNIPYKEEDPPGPLNEYGKSKYLGELFVQEETREYLLFRVSWVFGPGRQNFIFKLLQWAREQPLLKVSTDEVSVPTWTRTIAEATLKAIEQGLRGLYHLVSAGHASRYEWAQFVLNCLGIEKPIEPVSSSVFNLPARRPKYSVMSSEKLFGILELSAPHWKQSVEEFLKDEVFSQKS